MTRKELKQSAKDQLRGNWAWAVGLSFFAGLINYVIADILNYSFTRQDIIHYSFATSTNYVGYVSGPPAWAGIVPFIFAIFSGMMIWGVTYTILQFRDKGEKANIFKGMFSAFTGKTFVTSFLTFLLYYIFLILWTLLFIIPGIIKVFSYAMTPYIMKDYYNAGKDPIRATEAISASRKLMAGHKWELFGLYLSFLGWMLLGAITVGIGFLWITPYIRQTMANFYRNLAGDQFLKAND